MLFQFVVVFVMLEAQLTGLRRRLNCGDDIAAPTACDGCSNNNNNNNRILSFFLFFVLCPFAPCKLRKQPPVRATLRTAGNARQRELRELTAFVYLCVSVSVCERELTAFVYLCVSVCERDRDCNSIAPSEQQQQATHIKPK